MVRVQFRSKFSATGLSIYETLLFSQAETGPSRTSYDCEDFLIPDFDLSKRASSPLARHG